MRGNLPLGGTSPAGELRHRSYRGNGVSSVCGEKIAYGEKSAVRGVRCTQKIKHNDESKIAKLYRTAYSTYRPYGSILRKIILCCRVDKGFDTHESAYPAAAGQINVVGWFEIQSDGVLADL